MDAVRKISVSPYSAPIEPCSEKVGVELRGYLVISKIKIIYSVVDNILYIEYIKKHMAFRANNARTHGLFLVNPFFR